MFTIGPVVRYYIAEGLFGQGYFGFGTAKEKYDDGSGTRMNLNILFQNGD
jgi:hypothetical protein